MDFDSPAADDLVNDAPGRFLDLAPRSIPDAAKLRRNASSLGKERQRFSARDDAIDDLRRPERSLVDEIGGEAFDIACGHLGPDD
jgi:hypothetical protein